MDFKEQAKEIADRMDRDELSYGEVVDALYRALQSAYERGKVEAYDEALKRIDSLDFVSNDDVVRGQSGERSMQMRAIGAIFALKEKL